MSMLLGKTTDNGIGDHMLLTNKSKAGDEEARAFLTFCSSGADSDRRSSVHSVEQGVYRRRSWNYVIACLLVSLALIGSTVLVVVAYRSSEVAALRTELDALRSDVDSLRQRILGEDLLEQLRAFEDAVYAEEAASEGDDHDDDDCDGYDYDSDYSSEERTPSRLTHHKKQHVDKTTEDRVTHSHDKMGHQAEPSAGSVAERSKREIQSSVLPVISESYGVDYRHNNTNSEGLRLYESLVSSGGKNEPKDTSLDWSSTENPIKNYHRVSPLWTPKSQEKKYVGSHPEYSNSPVHRRHRNWSQPTTTSAPAPIISRVSRVMETDPINSLLHQPPPPTPLTLHPQHHKLPDGETVVRVYQEQRASQGATVSGPGDTITVGRNEGKSRTRRKKHRPQRKNLAQVEGLDDHPVRSGRPVVAAHYDGDTSNYKLGHTHYQGNGRLRHPDGKFTDWTATSWMQQLGMNRFFQLNDGIVTVRDGGIYHIYAQIYYVDEHDVNGFRVYLNDRPVLHCTTMTVHSSDEQKRAKSNTCYTSAAVYIAPDDKISVRDVDGLRYSLFEPAKSFFGLIKLGDARIK